MASTTMLAPLLRSQQRTIWAQGNSRDSVWSCLSRSFSLGTKTSRGGINRQKIAHPHASSPQTLSALLSRQTAAAVQKPRNCLYYSTSPVSWLASIDRLGLGGRKWTDVGSGGSGGGPTSDGGVQPANPRYAATVQAALEQGVRTFEAGQEGGDAALASILRAALEQEESSSLAAAAAAKENATPIQCLLRVGYRTVTPPDASDAADAEVHNLFFVNDVPVAEEMMEEAGENRVFHNIGSDYLDYVLSESALVKLQQDFPDRIQLVVLLHNPEVQRTSSSSDVDLEERLIESFVALQGHVNSGRISSFGVVSNGFCLPRAHPLHLSWRQDVIQAALVAQKEINSPLALSVLQLPMNLLETTGIDMARNIQAHIQEAIASSTTSSNDDDGDDDSTANSSFLQQLQIYAMRPLTCYPDRGTGTGHPFVLADHLLPATMEKSLQWTHEMTAPPAVYQIALTTAMAHFDAEEILQIKMTGERELTAEERETLDGCKLMQSLLHDVDVGLSKVRSFAAHEEQVTIKIIPLIHDTFESYDEDTAAVLQSFFGAYSLAVRYSIAKNTRQLLTGASGEGVGANSVLEGSAAETTPTYPDLPPAMRLQEYALQYLLKESAVDKIIVGASQPEQIVDTAEIVRNCDTPNE